MTEDVNKINNTDTLRAKYREESLALIDSSYKAVGSKDTARRNFIDTIRSIITNDIPKIEPSEEDKRSLAKMNKLLEDYFLGNEK